MAEAFGFAHWKAAAYTKAMGRPAADASFKDAAVATFKANQSR